MPELAEVFYNASVWMQGKGRRYAVEWVDARSRCCRSLIDTDLKAAIDGAILEEGLTHGKRMLFEFSGGSWLEVHLGMTGALSKSDASASIGKHDHLVLRSDETRLVFTDPRQFGKIALHRSENVPDWWLALPPEPQNRAFTRKRFGEICARRSGSVAKAFLLDQQSFPGVGNWMADEILWQAELRPDRRVGSFDATEREALFTALKHVCRGALQTVGVDYRDPPASWLFRYRWKDGGKCPKTGEPLRREEIGGRTTCWSPAWQK